MPFGASGQKFPMGGLGFEGQQGMGSSPGGLLGNDMVMYPTYDKTSSLYSLFLAFFLLLHLAYLNTRLVGGSGLERGLFFICPRCLVGGCCYRYSARVMFFCRQAIPFNYLYLTKSWYKPSTCTKT